ncbi:MAG: ATP-binding protein [Odoribacteraceae bacterium]|nr:ATP-binding protein [Odoribacteraceae bacterium]
MKQIVRRDYMNALVSLRDKNLVKVLTGVRRCGKSTVMRMFADYLRADGVGDDQIVFLNFEEFENRGWLANPGGLYARIVGGLNLSKPCYVFLDEVQQVKGFERLVDGLYVKPNVDVYVAGSNAYLLSSELGTLLAGRYIAIHVLPFSFKEFLLTRADVSRTDVLFARYMDNGGLPGIFELPESAVRGYVQSVVQNIIQKDVLTRNRWRNEEYFSKTISFLFDSIGSVVPRKRIMTTLKASGVSLSHDTLDSHINALVNFYLFYRVKRFDLREKGLLATREKFYTVDLGMKKFFPGDEVSHDLGHNLENVVYLELIRRGNTVNIGKVGDTEIDFVCRHPDGNREYIQVAWTTKERATFEREMRPFKLVKDLNRRLLLTTDVEPVTIYKGIRKINVIDWLLQGDDALTLP